MRVPIPNAFTIHQLGIAGRPFPLSAALREPCDGVRVLDLVALRFADMVDVLTANEAVRFVVHGVEQSSHWNEDEQRSATLSELAAENAVAAIVLDTDSLLVSAADMRKLLEEVAHHQLLAFD